VNKAIQTKPTNPITDALRTKYLRWRLDNLEMDIAVHEENAKLARAEAEALRVELAQLGQL